MNKKIKNKLLLSIYILLVCIIIGLVISPLKRCCILYFLLILTTLLLSLTYKEKQIKQIFRLIILLIPYIYAIYIFFNKNWQLNIKGIKIIGMWSILILTLSMCLIIYLRRKNYILLAFSLKYNNLSTKEIIIQIFQLVFISIFEEICYRGIILNEILKVTGVTKAVFISSCLFVIHHYCSSLYENCRNIILLELFIFSIILGSFSIIAEGIWITIYAHILYNSPQMVIYICKLIKNK